MGRFLNKIIGIAEKQIDKGLKTYGRTIEDNNLTVEENLTYLEEELVDALFYIEALKEKLK